MRPSGSVCNSSPSGGGGGGLLQVRRCSTFTAGQRLPHSPYRDLDCLGMCLTQLDNSVVRLCSNE